MSKIKPEDRAALREGMEKKMARFQRANSTMIKSVELLDEIESLEAAVAGLEQKLSDLQLVLDNERLSHSSELGSLNEQLNTSNEQIGQLLVQIDELTRVEEPVEETTDEPVE